VKGLGYKVPSLVGEKAKELLSLVSADECGRTSTNNNVETSAAADGQCCYYRAILDAGCGTGLAGRFLRPLLGGGGSGENSSSSGIMIGVDASKKMLDIASKCTRSSGCGLPITDDDSAEDVDANSKTDRRPLYDGLLEMDLEDMTVENTLGTKTSSRESFSQSDHHLDGFDLVVAADVLVYFGSLDKILSTFATVSSSSPDGIRSGGAGLIFSCERASDEEAPLGYRLLPTGRFAHTKRYVVEAASKSGYDLVSYEEIVPRTERGEDVKGHLFAFVLRPSELNDEL